MTMPAIDDRETMNGWDYLSILRSQWRIIVFFTVLFMLGAVAVRFLVPNSYEARVITVPAQNTTASQPTALNSLMSLGLLSASGSASPKELAIATLSARSFLVSYAQQPRILHQLFADRWDTRSQRWNEEGAPSEEQIFERLSGKLTVESSAADNIITVRIRDTNSAFAAEIANGLVALLNRQFQAKAVIEADRMVSYLMEAYQATQISEVRTNLANLMQDHIRQRILAKSRDDYQLTVIDPAKATTRKVNPGLSILLPVGLMLGLFLGIPAAFLAHTTRPRWRGPLAGLLAPRA